MTTATIQLYSYSDLILPENREILDNVIDNWEQDDFYRDEIAESVNDFCKLFGFKTGRTYDHISFYMENDVEGQRLRTWIINNFDLWQPKVYRQNYRQGNKKRRSRIFKERNEGNGIYYCMDLIDVIFDFLKNPTDMDDLCGDIGNKIAKMFEDEEEYTRSEEYILESIEANGYKFEEDGEMY